MSVPEELRYPVTEFSLEAYVNIIINTRTPSHGTNMRGVHGLFSQDRIEVGKKYKVSKEDSRTVIHTNSYFILFYRDNEEKLFHQEVIGFSLDVENAAFVLAGQKSIGTVYFAKIIYAIISTGFAASSFPAFILITGADFAQSIYAVKSDPKIRMIIKFFITYFSVKSLLEKLSDTLHDKLFYYLLKKVGKQVAYDLDPTSIVKIVTSLTASIVFAKLKISDKVLKSKNKIPPLKLILKISLAIAKSLATVLSTMPKSIYKTGHNLENNARHLGIKIGTSLRKMGVDVSQEEYGELINEFQNVLVLDELIRLSEAARELEFSINETKD